MTFSDSSTEYQRHSPFKHRTVVASMLTLMGVVLASCSDSRIAQCNQLIEVANEAANEVESVTQSASPDDTEAFLRIADTAEEAAAKLEELELSDETLQGYKQRFISLYIETSSATRDLVNAVEEQDGPAAEQAYNQLENATGEEDPLVESVNDYCGGTPDSSNG